VDDTDATVGDFLEIGDVKLESGATATTFVNDNYEDTLAHCLRYLQAYISTAANMFYGFGGMEGTTTFNGSMHFPVQFRANPTATYSAANKFRAYTTGALAASSIATSTVSPNSIRIQCTVASGTAGHAGMLQDAGGNDSYIVLSAEL